MAQKLKDNGWSQKKPQFAYTIPEGKVCDGYCSDGDHNGNAGSDDKSFLIDLTLIDGELRNDVIGIGEYGNDNCLHYPDFIAAPTAQEIFDALPVFTSVVKTKEGYEAGGSGDIIYGSKTMANSLAAYWIAFVGKPKSCLE